jgi:nitrite reductase/ring-hydroxylating ferredoxin subunit
LTEGTSFIPTIALAELEPGSMRRVSSGSREWLLCRAGSEVHATQLMCSHADARLDEGRLKGHRLICPMHGAAFDVRDGRVLSGVARAPIRSYCTRVQNGIVEIADAADLG